MSAPGRPGRLPTRRRAGAIAALTGVAVLLHAALLSEVRWGWPAPPVPFAAMQVRAIVAPRSAEPEVRGGATEGARDAGLRIDSAALRTGADAEARDHAARRVADADVELVARGSVATKPIAPRPVARGGPQRERTDFHAVGGRTVAGMSSRNRQNDAMTPGSPVAHADAAVRAIDAATRAHQAVPDVDAAAHAEPAVLGRDLAATGAAHPKAAAGLRMPAEVLATGSAAEPSVPEQGPVSTGRAPTSASVDAEAAAIPLYRTLIPPPVALRYALRVAGAAGTAELRWRADGEAYGLRFDGRVEGGPTLTQMSDGAFDLAGLAPVRHTDARTRRGMLATNFQRDAGRISFSGSRTQLPLARGSQDRLSWMIQLAAVLAAEPVLREPGAVVSIPVAGLRGEAAVWRFQVVPSEASFDARSGPPRVRLLRDRQGPYDVDIEVVLDPARHFLPASVSLRNASGVPALELTLQDALFER